MAVVEAIATTYLEADAAGITFSSIPATYENLRLSCSLRTNGTNRSSVQLTFNNDTGAGQYASNRIIGSSNALTGGSWPSLTGMLSIGACGGDSKGDNYSSNTVDILDYASTNKKTTCWMFTGAKIGSDDSDLILGNGLWQNTDAVHTITLDGSYGLIRGSVVTLYGWNSS